ncbi:MAG: zinc-dependent metalloprotease [Alistipes sp.]|nr:zinc-dependent metalloprotease [Alistipes sp.]
MRILAVFAVLFTLSVLEADAGARWFFKRKRVKEPATEQPAVTPVVAPYDKVILNAKNRTTKDGGAFKIHKIGDKIYLEIPDRLLGREVLLSSYLDRTGDLSMAEPGTQAMLPTRYTFEKTDSLVLLRKPSHNVHITDGDANISRAMELSAIGATAMSFPIAAVNFDTTAVVFDATKLLFSNGDLVDMTGRQLSGDFRITSSRPETKFAFIEGIDAFENGVSVSSETGLKLEATGYMGFVIMDMESTVSLMAYLTLLPEEKMAAREADNRIGTGFYPYTGLSADGGTRQGYLAKKVRLEPGDERDSSGLYEPLRPIEVYVDTLFSENWFDAIRNGLSSWNAAFEEAGFRDAVRVLPYPEDPRFNANDPILKIVRMGQGLSTSVTYQTFDDPRSGEIAGFTITVPRDYVQGLRRNAVYTISEADPRYREYFLPDDAVAEALTAEIVRAAAFCFGLGANYAGSYAFSPDQIRDPWFSARYGFTASVTDGIIFNHLARPADRERGIKTVMTGPGIYDRFAVKWLYSHIPADEKGTLDRWLKEVEGKPGYLYVRPQSTRFPYDPRAFSKDLGNDIFASVDRQMETVKFVFANAHMWLEDDGIPSGYTSLFPDFAVLKFDEVILSLCAYIGGIYINETSGDSGRPRYEPVPRELQRAALLKILSLFDDLSWLDANPRLMELAGMDKRVSQYVESYWPVRYIMQRLTGRYGAMALSVASSEDHYTQKQALDDLSGYIFKDITAGREITTTRMAMAGGFIDQLIGSVEVLRSNFEANNSSGTYFSDTFADGFHPGFTNRFPGLHGQIDTEAAPSSITTIGYYTEPDLSGLFISKLKEARSKLVAGQAYCRSAHSQDKYAYYVSRIDMALTAPNR